MEIRKLLTIHDLAQNFLKAPRINNNEFGLSITYDYEMESGEYGEKTIFFEDVKDYRYTSESDVTKDILNAYNAISEVVNSTWLSRETLGKGYKHYIIYFDEYGAYEIIAKSYRFPK